MLSALPAVAAEPRLTFDPVVAALLDFKRLLQEVCQDGFVSIYKTGQCSRNAAVHLTRAFLSAQLCSDAFFFVCFVVRDVMIVEHATPAADLQTTQPAENQAASGQFRLNLNLFFVAVM